MSKALQSQYNTFRSATNFWLYTAGICPSKKDNLLLHLLPFLHLSLFILPIYGVYNTLVHNISNVLVVARSISPLTGFLTVCTKVVCIIINRKEIYDLYLKLDRSFEKVLINSQVQKHILKRVRSFRRIPLAISILIAITCLSFSITPLIFLEQQIIRHIDHMKYILPYPTVYPWEIPPASFLYLFHLVSQSLTNLSIVCITSGVDTLWSFHIFQMTAMLRDISYRLTNFDATKNRKVIVCECLQQYNIVLECRDKLQKIYGPIVLWTMGTNAILLCGIAFQLTHLETVSIARITLFLLHGGMKTIQIFMYNWAGTRLTEESEKYRIALYYSDWLENKKLMKIITIALGQRPLYLRAGSYLIISLDMFLYVMNATVSYFVFLQAVDQS